MGIMTNMALDRLVKGRRVAEVATLEGANQYLEQAFLPWWNQHFLVLAANPAEAHRPLDQSHNLAASLSRSKHGKSPTDYAFRYQNRCRRAGAGRFRGANVRGELRLDRFRITKGKKERRPKTAPRTSALLQPKASARELHHADEMTLQRF
jgi:hypothetical protein